VGDSLILLEKKSLRVRGKSSRHPDLSGRELVNLEERSPKESGEVASPQGRWETWGGGPFLGFPGASLKSLHYQEKGGGKGEKGIQIDDRGEKS